MLLLNVPFGFGRSGIRYDFIINCVTSLIFLLEQEAKKELDVYEYIYELPSHLRFLEDLLKVKNTLTKYDKYYF